MRDTGGCSPTKPPPKTTHTPHFLFSFKISLINAIPATHRSNDLEIEDPVLPSTDWCTHLTGPVLSLVSLLPFLHSGCFIGIKKNGGAATTTHTSLGKKKDLTNLPQNPTSIPNPTCPQCFSHPNTRLAVS